MRLTTCSYDGAPEVGVVSGEDVVLLSRLPDPAHRHDTVLSVIASGAGRWRDIAVAAAQVAPHERISLSRVKLLAPIPRPSKNVMCLGWNYAEHIEESASGASSVKAPEYPVVFTKSVSSVTGPFSDIPYEPEVCSELDWEVELGVIIGKGGRAIPLDNALEHIFGYTVINDVSARDIQFRHQQFFLGKSLDGACPMGPWIVTAEEVGDPQDLNLRCWVNGQLKQESNTRHQIFDVATTISTLSLGMTLEPGDIIATGTPSGVGFARTPPEFLRPGDVVECEIEGIGRICNHVV